MTDNLNDVRNELAQPFDESEIKWKPQVTTRGRNKEPIMRNGTQVAGCTAHIDARNVMARLDDVVGPAGWSDSYRLLDGKHVECTLTVLGISKSDVGEPNADGFADPMKSAYSDALKRAAVKFGIGRHLYAMEMAWLPFDGYRITDKPSQPKQSRNGRKQSKPKSDKLQLADSAKTDCDTYIAQVVARHPYYNDPQDVYDALVAEFGDDVGVSFKSRDLWEYDKAVNLAAQQAADEEADG